jgi:hypothetical protein
MAETFIPVELEEETQQSSFLSADEPQYNEQPESYKRLQASMAAVVNGESGSYKEDFDSKMSVIESLGESIEREKATGNRLNRLTNNLQGEIDKGAITDELLTGSVQFLVDERQRDQQFSMEKEFIQKYENFASENPNWSDLRVLNKDFLSTQKDLNTKDLIISNAMRKKAFDLEQEDSFIGDTVDIVTDIFSAGAQNFISFLRAGDWEGGGEALRAKGMEIRQLPIDEIPAAMEDFYQYLEGGSALLKQDDERALRQFRSAMGTSDVSMITAEESIISLLETVGAPLFSLGRTTLAKMTAKVGGTDRVVEDASIAMRSGVDVTNASTVESIEEAVELSMPVRVAGEELDGLSPTIRADLEANQKALEDLKTIATPDRLNPEELASATLASIARYKKVNNTKEISHTVPTYDESTGVYTFDILQGIKSGNAFASEATARTAMTKAKTGGEVVQSPSGGWYINHKQVITDAFADKGFQNMQPVNSLQRWVQAPKAFVATVLGKQGTAAGSIDARITGVVKEIYNKNIRKLPSKDFQKVFQVADEGRVSEVWYSANELAAKYLGRHGEQISEAQTKAYMTARQISDLGYHMENKAAYKQAAGKGLESITLPGRIRESFNGRLITDSAAMTEAIGSRVYNAIDNTFYRLDQEGYELLVKRGMFLARPEDSSWTVEILGEGASYIAGSPRQVKSSALDPVQVGYTGGGRIVYDDKFFVGQTRSGQFSDGTRYQLRPKTHRSAKTLLEAEKYAAMHNSAMKLMSDWEKYGGKKGKRARDRDGVEPMLLSEMNERIFQIVGQSVEQYSEFIKREGFDIDVPIHVRKDREAPPVDYDEQAAVRMYDPESLSSGYGVNKMGRLSARTDNRLKNINEDDAVQLDFITALNTSMDSAIRAGAYTDFKISAINRFNTEFRKYYDNPQLYSPYEIATGAAPLRKDFERSSKNKGDLNQLKAHQTYIRSILRQPTNWDNTIQHMTDRFAYFVENGSDKTKLAKAGKYVSTKISEVGDPIGRIRGLNFDFALGMFNPAQVFMQANAVLTGLTLSPKHGMAAFQDIPLMRYALIINDDATGSVLAKSGDYPELMSNLNQFKRLGFNDFGANLAMMDAQSTLGATTNRLASNVTRTREAGRFFFQEGERYGRLMAYNIARRSYAEIDHAAAKLDNNIYSRDADNWIREETDRLLLSPNSDNNQLFTKGLTALPTQFWSYMSKMADAVLTGSGGRYTAGERVRLAGGQALFYGTAGIPLGDWAIDKYQKETGDVMSETGSKFIHNGLIDTTIFALSGGTMDTDFSDSSGLGSFIGQMADNLIENPVAEVFFGATGSKVSSSMGVMAETARMYSLWENPTIEGVTKTSLAGLSSIFSSMDKVTRGILAYNTGIWFSKHGDAIGDITPSEAFISIFGVKPQLESDVFNSFTDQKNSQIKYVDDVGQALEGLHAKWERATSQKEKDHIESLINTFANLNKQSGYYPEMVEQVMRYKKTRTFQEGAENKLFKSYSLGRDVNPEYLSKEVKQQLREELGN